MAEQQVEGLTPEQQATELKQLHATIEAGKGKQYADFLIDRFHRRMKEYPQHGYENHIQIVRWVAEEANKAKAAADAKAKAEAEALRVRTDELRALEAKIGYKHDIPDSELEHLEYDGVLFPAVREFIRAQKSNGTIYQHRNSYAFLGVGGQLDSYERVQDLDQNTYMNGYLKADDTYKSNRIGVWAGRIERAEQMRNKVANEVVRAKNAGGSQAEDMEKLEPQLPVFYAAVETFKETYYQMSQRLYDSMTDTSGVGDYEFILRVSLTN